MSNSSALILSANAIKGLFELSTHEKKTFEVNLQLQVINIRKCDQNKKGSACEMFTATLSDSKGKYNGFIIFSNEGSETLEESDIIYVPSITPAKINNQKSRVFIVKKYKIITKGAEIFGDPELIKDGEEKEDERMIIENSVHTTGVSTSTAGNFTNYVASGHHGHNNQNSYTSINSITTTKIKKEFDVEEEDINTLNRCRENSNKGALSNSANNSSNLKGKYYTPLSLLTTFSKDFQILVRVLKKSDLKTFNSSPNKSGGTLFSFNVLDEEGNEMQVTCFNKAVQKFYNTIAENKIFEITGGYVKINNQKFTSVKSEYKIVIDENSQVVEKMDDGSIQHQKYNFVKISQLAQVPLYSVVDCIGYVLEVGDLILKNTKNGEQPMKKIVLVDTSDSKIEFTLWRVFAHREVLQNQVIALKNVKVGEFNGRNISTFEESGVLVDPSMMKEAAELRLYIETCPREKIDTFKNISLPTEKAAPEDKAAPSVLFIKDVLDMIDDVINDDKLPISRIKATVTQMMHNDKNFYGGCEDIRCKKKLSKDTYNWSCISCNKSYDKPTYYYTLSIRVKDCSSEHWIDIFGNVAEKLLKITAEDYKDLLQERDQFKLQEITSAIEFKTFYFYVKPKLHFYNSVPKKKLYAYKIEVVDPVVESKRLIKSLTSEIAKLKLSGM
jgi:replication factor A1